MKLPPEDEQITGIAVTRGVLKRLKKLAQKRHPGLAQCHAFNAMMESWLTQTEKLEESKNTNVQS